MKKAIAIFIVVFLSFHSGCGNKIEYQMPKEGKVPIEKWLDQLPKQDTVVPLENRQVMDNSNLLNMGYLVVDHEEKKIYYVDFDVGQLVQASLDGSDKKVIGNFRADYLQLYDGKIYCREEDSHRLLCIEKNGEFRYLTEDGVGEYAMIEQKIYAFGQDGLLCMDMDGNVLNKPFRGICQFVNFQAVGNDIWGNIIYEEDVNVFMEGYLIVYHTESDEYSFVANKSLYPLIYGENLSVWNIDAAQRENQILGSEDRKSLGTYDQRPVSDGKSLYFVEYHDGINCLWKYDGESNFVLHEMDDLLYPEYKYVAEGYLYFVMRDIETSKLSWHIYNMENGSWTEL